MSNALTTAARPIVMDPSAKAVLMALCDMAREPDDPDRPSQAWPPMHGQDGAVGLCDWTCLSERSVQRGMKLLMAAGHISRRQMRHGVIYTVHPASAPTPVILTPDNMTPDNMAARPVILAPKAPQSTKRKKATPSPSTRVAPADDIPADLPGGVTPEQWAGFADMRRRMASGPKGRPWTVAAARLAVAKLNELADAGQDAGAVLDQSVLNGWQGLFPVKGTETRNGFLAAVLDAERRDRPSGWAPRPGMEGVEPASLDDEEGPWRNR